MGGRGGARPACRARRHAGEELCTQGLQASRTAWRDARETPTPAPEPWEAVRRSRARCLQSCAGEWKPSSFVAPFTLPPCAETGGWISRSSPPGWPATLKSFPLLLDTLPLPFGKSFLEDLIICVCELHACPSIRVSSAGACGSQQP